MRIAYAQSRFASGGAPLLHRSGSLLLVLGLHLLLFLMLLHLAPPIAPPLATRPTLVELISDGAPAPARTEAEEENRAAPSPAKPSQPTELKPVPTEVPPVPPPSAIWSKVIPLTRQELAAADIARLRSPPARHPSEGDTGEARGRDLGDTAAVGKGPNGELLYNAQWYRRPTSAELGTYLPPGRSLVGWGMIACRTVPDYRVDDCQEIGQFPAGSGLARAVRQAAWQFRVVPPRIGGRPMVGTWVSIRIEYTTGKARIAES